MYSEYEYFSTLGALIFLHIKYWISAPLGPQYSAKPPHWQSKQSTSGPFRSRTPQPPQTLMTCHMASGTIYPSHGGVWTCAQQFFFYFCPSSFQRVSRGRSMVPYCTCVGESQYQTIDTLFCGGEKKWFESNPLLQRNKYQNGFYCDAIWQDMSNNIMKEYARAEEVSAGFGVDLVLASDLSHGIRVSETAEY